MTGGAVYGVVANFSEGRRDDVIDAICAALAVPGARLVYRQSDPDHHRLDTTVLGDRDAVWRSAMAGARVAVALIDMDRHTGGHPRMGAVDVIPFMPVRGVTMEATIELARTFGRELATELDLPVYLYDRAALLSERASLADVRRGEYEGIKADVAHGEAAARLRPARRRPGRRDGRGGAQAARRVQPVPHREDAAAAKEIARTVRTSGGGLPALRAIGFSSPNGGASPCR